MPRATADPGQRHTAVTISPRPCRISGSDGDRLRVLELFSPRRVAVPDLRPRQSRPRCGPGARYSVRTRKLTLTEESTIRALATTRSLRSLAAGFGVGHETVRAALRQATSGTGPVSRVAPAFGAQPDRG